MLLHRLNFRLITYFVPEMQKKKKKLEKIFCSSELCIITADKIVVCLFFPLESPKTTDY